MKTVDEYLNGLSADQRQELEKIRELVKELVPDTEEVMSYGVPTFKYHKRPLLYYAAYTNHFSIYPASDEMIKVVGKDLEKFRASKGTLRFIKEQPIPNSLLKEIILFQAHRIDAKT